MKVRIGRVREGSKLALHLEIAGKTCDVRRPVNVEAKTKNVASRRCKSCFTEARIALAEIENNTAPTWSPALAAFLVEIAEPSKLNPAGYNSEHDAERAAIAATWAAFEADVTEVAPVVEPVAQLSAWGALRANNLRTLPQDAKRARRYVNLAA